jgi:hypothetical protein
MNALQLAYKRLVRQPDAGVWIGAIRKAVDASEQGPAHYLVAAWPPLAPGQHLLPRWPSVAASASPDADAALLMLMSQVSAAQRVWLAPDATDWALIATIVLDSDRHLTTWQRSGLEGFVAAERERERAFIRREYSDRDEGFEAFKRKLDPGVP